MKGGRALWTGRKKREATGKGTHQTVDDSSAATEDGNAVATAKGTGKGKATGKSQSSASTSTPPEGTTYLHEVPEVDDNSVVTEDDISNTSASQRWSCKLNWLKAKRRLYVSNLASAKALVEDVDMELLKHFEIHRSRHRCDPATCDPATLCVEKEIRRKFARKAPPPTMMALNAEGWYVDPDTDGEWL